VPISFSGSVSARLGVRALCLAASLQLISCRNQATPQLQENAPQSPKAVNIEAIGNGRSEYCGRAVRVTGTVRGLRSSGYELSDGTARIYVEPGEGMSPPTVGLLVSVTGMVVCDPSAGESQGLRETDRYALQRSDLH